MHNRNMSNNKIFQLVQIATKLKPMNFLGHRKKNIIKYTGLGLGCFSSALVLESANDYSNSTVFSNVNAGFRFLRSLKIGLLISIDYYFSMLGLNESSSNYKIMMSRIHQRAANEILDGCLRNGGTYIKLGQGLVCLSHILPLEYVKTLNSLQDKCLMRKKDELIELFKQDFGKHPSEMFKDFVTEPIAAASIAQVYQATTLNNEKVAVKVQYIDLQNRFKSDIWTINFLLKIVGVMHPNFNFDWVLKDLQGTLKQELDFVNEAKNSEKCSKDLKHLNYIYIPKVLWDYSSNRVLVTEFIDAYKISDVRQLRENGFSLVDINNKLFEAFGHQIFRSGFVHADPHPGNVLVRRNKGQTELVILDHGLYQQISDENRIALSHFWKAIVFKDYAKMKQYSKVLGVEDYELFAEILTQSPLKTHGFKLRSKLTAADLQQMTDFARERFDKIMVCLQCMPRTLLLVIRNLNTIRSIAHDHGNPIDRYAVLARTATKTAFENKGISWWYTIEKFSIQIYFELLLVINRITTWIAMILVDVLCKLGLIPDPKTITAHIGN